MTYNVDEKGYYGDFGGAFIPEMLYPNVEELRQNYLSITSDPTFKTEFDDEVYGPLGIDKAKFLIRTNPKSEMNEIKKISSGGELCRIALAIKVTAEQKNVSTMVFDEVDSGIGGAVSTAVGERLKKLGKIRQVLVVTHSPQVASLGVHHFLVKKKLLNNEIPLIQKKIILLV